MLKYEKTTINTVITVYTGLGIAMIICCFCNGKIICWFCA